MQDVTSRHRAAACALLIVCMTMPANATSRAPLRAQLPTPTPAPPPKPAERLDAIVRTKAGSAPPLLVAGPVPTSRAIVRATPSPQAGATLAADGSLRFFYGAAIPEIHIGVGDSCDIELEPGETIRRAFLADSARWRLADGVSGANNVPHLIVKPTQASLTTMLTVLTDRRAYICG